MTTDTPDVGTFADVCCLASGGKAFAVDAKIEYPAFTSWWGRTIPAEPVPSASSHYFGVWMESARHRALASPKPVSTGDLPYLLYAASRAPGTDPADIDASWANDEMAQAVAERQAEAAIAALTPNDKPVSTGEVEREPTQAMLVAGNLEYHRGETPLNIWRKMWEVQQQRNALAKALCLLDTLAGEGVGHVYGNGQEIMADDACCELAAAFGIEPDVGWWRLLPDLAFRSARPPVPGDAGGEETA